jgi:alkylhydroperoxidase family enzyme
VAGTWPADRVAHGDERRFELVTVVAASRVKCSVCTLQHGASLQSYLTAEQVQSVACDLQPSGLDTVDEAIVAFAERVVLHAEEIRQDDIDGLRSVGLDDAEIFDIVLAATYRMGWSSTNEAIGYEPSQPFLARTRSQLGDDVFQSLMVGRQFEPPAANGR